MGVGSVEAALLPPPLLPRIGASAVRARLEKRAMKRSRALAIRFTELRSSGAARKPIPPREVSRKRRTFGCKGEAGGDHRAQGARRLLRLGRIQFIFPFSS